MPGTHMHMAGHARRAAPLEPKPRAHYVVLRRDDAWFIIFTRQEFGPYKSEREAKLFAIDAAHKLAEQDEPSEVSVMDETGALSSVWVGDRDPYPPLE